jgi:osmotically-inducible protein OsmY
MNTRTFQTVVGVGLGVCCLLAGIGCGRDSAVEIRRDNRGNEQIHVDNGKIQDNLHQAGQELSKDAHNLGQAIQQGARDVDQRVGPVARETLADAALTTRVKTRLIAAPDLGGVRIHVSSRDGKVTLSGTVASEENRLDAVKIARRTDGVREVVDQLQVGPQS